MPFDAKKSYAPADLDEAAASPEWGEILRRIYFESKRLLAAWWWIILLTVASGIGWQAYKELNRDPIYVSEAEMMISGQFALPDSVYREELSNFFGTQISLMLSEQVQQQARERVTMLHPDFPRSWVRLSVNQRPEASIFQLRAAGGKPEFTRAFLDAVMEEYQNFRQEMRSETTESTLLAVTEQLYRLEEEIETQENTIVEFQKENNLVFLKEQDASTGAYLAELTTQQAELRTQLLLIENLKPGDLLNFSTEQSPLIRAESVELYQQTRHQWTQLKAELEEFSLYLKPQHPKIIDLELKVERAADRIDILNRQTLQSLGERKDQLRRQIRNLDSVIAQWEKQALAISRKGAEFERLQYRMERSRNTYQGLLDSMQAIQSNQNIEQETVGVLAPASKAAVQSPEVIKKVAKGAVAGLLFGIMVLAAIAFLDTRIRTSDELVKRFDFPLLGIIPDEAQNTDEQVDLLQIKDQRHRFAEACRTLRSSILLREAGEEESSSCCIAVSSSIPSEGKSTISANLAIALAHINKRVLLIDADMRQGGIHHLFSLKPKEGLSELLRGDGDAASFVHETGYANLELIKNGESVFNSGELLLSKRMDELLEWAKENYDYVIVDTPPILAVNDTIGLSAKVDSMAMVIRANQISPRQMQASLDRLSTRTSKIIGFVFNRAPIGGVDYYYYNHYYDGYYGQPEGNPEESVAEETKQNS